MDVAGLTALTDLLSRALPTSPFEPNFDVDMFLSRQLGLALGLGFGLDEGPNHDEFDGLDETDILTIFLSASNDDYVGLRHEEEEGFLDYLLEFETEFENALTTTPRRAPASKSVVESLPSVVLSEEDLRETNEVLCAICNDGLGSTKEEVKQLPCLHRYHEDCIVQWLRISSTCPLCRYELPTDDFD